MVMMTSAINVVENSTHRQTIRVLVNYLVLGFLLLLFPMTAVCAGNGKRNLAGTWAGTLKVGLNSLRLALHLTKSAGGLTAKLDSLDQGAMGIPCTGVTLKGAAFNFQVPAVGGAYSGTLNANGKIITGNWNQNGQSFPLTFSRVAPGAQPEPANGMVPTTARPPVSLTELPTVLDREFMPVLKNGILKKTTGGGVVIGVFDHGRRRIFAFGAAHANSVFEIGSVTKTFTALALAQLVEQKKVALDDSVRSLLPNAAVPKPKGPEITLLELATQRSGLPRLPGNFHPSQGFADPYADYHGTELLSYLEKRGVAVPKNANYLYSNLGYGLLGFILASRSGASYSQMIHREITAPLHLEDTTIFLTPEQRQWFIQGHNVTNQPVGPWHFDALAGCGALRSTAADMLTYLEAQLHPEKFTPADAPPGSPAATLSAAIAMTHKLYAPGSPGMQMGLAWMYVDGSGIYWHNGGTGGYTSFVLFSPQNDRAIVVLYNRDDIGESPIMFVQRIAANVNALMSGMPAIPLG